MNERRDLSAALGFAHEIARLGGRVALGHYGREPETKRKPDGTWATEGDWAAEAQIRLRIARAFPDHNVLGEEEGLSCAGGGGPRPGAPTWVVDPIDGTNNYIAGIPVWATLVALRVDETNVVGVCHAPALAETYDAAVGLGARCNGAPIAVDGASDLARATACTTGAEAFFRAGAEGFLRALSTSCARTRGYADFWGHMLVARGAAHVMVETEVNLWDVAALDPIVAEAGGRLTRLDGARDGWPAACLTTNGVLHDRVVALAREHGAV